MDNATLPGAEQPFKLQKKTSPHFKYVLKITCEYDYSGNNNI